MIHQKLDQNVDGKIEVKKLKKNTCDVEEWVGAKECRWDHSFPQRSVIPLKMEPGTKVFPVSSRMSVSLHGRP